jgi:restriction endonuclease S subunit
LGRFDEFQALRQGAAIPGIRKEHVESIEIPLPSRELQLQAIAFLEAVQGEVSEMQRAQADEAKMLDEIEQALLRQAFRGEL